MKLTTEDQEEIYNSLDSKLWLLKTHPDYFVMHTPDLRWIAQIEQILEKIGEDGNNLQLDEEEK